MPNEENVVTPGETTDASPEEPRAGTSERTKRPPRRRPQDAATADSGAGTPTEAESDTEGAAAPQDVAPTPAEAKPKAPPEVKAGTAPKAEAATGETNARTPVSRLKFARRVGRRRR